MWVDLLKIVFLGLVPPVVWQLSRGSRLSAKSKEQPENRPIDRDDFLWQVAVSASSVTFVGFMLLASGLLPFLGQGFVYAGEMDKRIEQRVLRTEQKIDAVAKKQEEAAKEQAETKQAVKSMQDLLLDSLTEGTQAKIRALISRRCKTLDTGAREEINKEKEKLQKAHIQYTGVRYVEPRCEEL